LADATPSRRGVGPIRVAGSPRAEFRPLHVGSGILVVGCKMLC